MKWAKTHLIRDSTATRRHIRKRRVVIFLASDFVGNVIFTFSRSRNLYLTLFDDKLRKDELLGECEVRGSHFLHGVLEAAKQELTVSTPEASPCATGCKATSGAVTTKSLRSRRTEGLSDKNSLYGKFGKNVVYGRVRSLRFALSP